MASVFANGGQWFQSQTIKIPYIKQLGHASQLGLTKMSTAKKNQLSGSIQQTNTVIFPTIRDLSCDNCLVLSGSTNGYYNKLNQEVDCINYPYKHQCQECGKCSGFPLFRVIIKMSFHEGLVSIKHIVLGPNELHNLKVYKEVTLGSCCFRYDYLELFVDIVVIFNLQLMIQATTKALSEMIVMFALVYIPFLSATVK